MDSGDASGGHDVSAVLHASGIAVSFSTTAAALSAGSAFGSDEIDVGIRVTNTETIAFDTRVIGGGISGFRPPLLPDEALVDDLANATARFASSTAGPYLGGADADGNANPVPALHVAANACITQGPACRADLPERQRRSLLGDVARRYGRDVPRLRFPARRQHDAELCQPAPYRGGVPALGGPWVVMVGLAALPPLRRPVPSRVGRGVPSRWAALGAWQDGGARTKPETPAHRG